MSYFIILLLIFTTDIFTQDSLNVSGVVLHPTSTEGDFINPEFLLPSLFDNIRVCQDATNEKQVEVSFHKTSSQITFSLIMNHKLNYRFCLCISDSYH